MKTYPTWRLGQKHYQRAVFWLKITSATSLLGLASCSNLPTLSSPLEWIKTSQSMVKGAVGSFIGASNTSKSSQYPKLSAFPSRPVLLSTSEDRKKIRNELVSDRKNASYIGTKSKLWPNSMPFKTKPIAPIKQDNSVLQPKISKKQVSYKRQLAQQKLKKKLLNQR